MTVDEAHKYFGRNWRKMAREIGFSKNSYQHWLKIGYIPIHTQIIIEEHTKGKLKASRIIRKEHAGQATTAS